jgi:hypothetical protein
MMLDKRGVVRSYAFRAAALSAVVAALFCQLSFGETLEDVLRAQRLPLNLESVQDRDKPITSYAILGNPRAFLIAYYWDDGSGILNQPLRLGHFNKTSGQWNSVALRSEDNTATDVDCLGSVAAIHAVADSFYLDIHINPSAGCLRVVSEDLMVRASLYGWFLAAFDDGTVLYHNSQVHFAPTHPTEISLYDPASNLNVMVYPAKPAPPIRAAHVRRVRQAYSDEAWCREHNHHCDPELFDSRLAGEVVANSATRSLAFVLALDNSILWTDAERAQGSAADGTPEFTNVLYVYKLGNTAGSFEFRELLLSDFQTRFGDVPLSKALEPDILREMFSR